MGIEVTLALGANVGEPIIQLHAAVSALREVMEISGISDIYVTEPVGIRDQPDFYNLVLRGATDIPVYSLHAETQRIEGRMGRTRTERNGPRAIDIDILNYGDLVLTSDALTLPHPRLHERSFVLVPLASIDPGWLHPAMGATASELMARLERPSEVASWGPLPAIHQ